MPKLELYGIYIVSFPFIESPKRKVRPVIVVSEPYGDYRLVTIVPITSKLVDDDTEVQLQDLKTTGLVVASSTQIHRMTTVTGDIIMKQIGCLNTQDIDCLKSTLKLKLNL
jgi:mRNA-degrading endonuclease toxin of MazEF toxin-antitoxin module